MVVMELEKTVLDFYAYMVGKLIFAMLLSWTPAALNRYVL